MKKIWKRGLAVGCLIGVMAASYGEPLQPKAIVSEPAWLLHVDVDALRSTAVGKQILTQLESEEEQAKFLVYKMILSFDPRRTLNGVTLYGVTPAPEDGVALIQADFDAEHLTRLAEMAEDHRTTTNRQHVVRSWIDAKRRVKEGGEPRTYAAIRGKVVIFGQKEQRVVETLDVLDGLKQSLKPGALLAMPASAGETVVIEGAAKQIELKGSEPHAAILKQAKGISLIVAEKGERVVGTLTLDAESEEVGKNMAALARGLVALLALQKDKPETVKFAQSLSVVEDGTRILIKLSMSSEEIIKAMKSKLAEKAAVIKTGN